MSEEKSITLNVTEMHCASCVARVEKALKVVKGVDDVSVNLVNQQAKVTYQNNKPSETELIRAVKKAGYEVNIIKTEEDTKKKIEN